jgi:crotonobetainyl-CoA:carnitine CoA-transferase CaiB-like acyl-CoA transferase
VADIAGGMYAYSNVLLALLQRGITGRGAHVEVSLFDGLLEWLGHQVTLTRQLERLPRRAGARHATIAPYGPFRCADGGDVVIAVQNTKEWRALCAALGVPQLADEERFETNHARVSNGDDLDARIAAVTAELSAEDLIERLERAGLAWGRVNDLFAVINHPQLEARRRWATVQTPNGSFEALRPPVDIEGIDVAMSDVPRLGQHTQVVLDWLSEPQE